jgi:glycosyltransferase involved in cell wall biosynthesis
MIQVLFLTTEWPTDERPTEVPFLVLYAGALRDKGVEIEVFHFCGRRNPINYVRAWFAVRRMTAWKKADILHAHWGQSAFLGLFAHKPLIITYHGSDLEGIVNKRGKYSIYGKILVTFSKWISKKTNYCITVSEKLKNSLPGSVQSEVIPMGIDFNLFHPIDQKLCRESLHMDPDNVIILFIGDPARPEKRYALAASAVNLVKSLIPERSIELKIVNNKSIYSMPYYLNAANLLLLTSAHEGSPVIIKEALACNLPIVATNVGDIKERISQVEGCYICEDDSAEAISRNLTQAILFPKRINGRETVRDLSWEIIAERTKFLYQKVLAEAYHE